MSKITQKNYEAIAIYRQKEKIFELKGQIQTLKQQLAIAIEALEKSAEINKLYLKAKDGAEIELDVNGSMWSVAREALQQIKELNK